MHKVMNRAVHVSMQAEAEMEMYVSVTVQERGVGMGYIPASVRMQVTSYCESRNFQATYHILKEGDIYRLRGVVLKRGVGEMGAGIRMITAGLEIGDWDVV